MRRIIFCAFLAGLAAEPAAADTYRYVSKISVDGSAVFLDEDSIVRSGDMVGYWIIQIDGNYLHFHRARFAYYLMREVINCQTQMMRPAAVSFYSPTGAPVTSDDKGAEASSIEPGTTEQLLYNSLCRNLPATDAVVNAESPLSLARDFREVITHGGKK